MEKRTVKGMATIRTILAAAALCAAAAAQLPARQYVQSSTERRGLLGVSLDCDNCFIMRAPGRVAYTRPPVFTSVTRSGAAGTAGIQTGDTLVTVDGVELVTPDGFERFVAMRPGVQVRLGVRRQGQLREFTVTPAEGGGTMSSYYNERLRIAQRLGAEVLRGSFRSPLGWLDVGLECEGCSLMSPTRRQQTWTFRTPPAVYTVGVDGPAHRGGLRRGDTLTHMDGVDLTTRQGGNAFANIEPGQRVNLTVRRDGRSRQVQLTAVPRPDATRAELAAFEEYRRMRDSTATLYAQVLAVAVARAQSEIRELETLLRTRDRSLTADDARRRLSGLDSAVRMLRELERQRARDDFTSMTLPSAEAWSMLPAPAVAPAAPVAPLPPSGRAGFIYPLRYSGRMGNLVNVEVRAAGAPYVQELGDSLVVIVMPDRSEVKVTARPQPRR
jgi:HPt (histidine-containing phosphotransfer) domain-containing protein